MKTLRFFRRRFFGRDSGQAATEYALIVGLMLFATPVLLNWAPDMFEAMNIYIYGFYYIVGTPLG